MHAVRIHAFGGPEVLRYETVDDPLPGAGQVRIAVRAVGVNPHDTYVRSGMVPGVTLPCIPGQDGAGVVDAIGEGVTDLSPGDRVYFGGTRSGAYASQVVCLAEQVHALPDALDFSQGAGLHVPYATAQLALFERAQLGPGETLLVRGASGAVGLAALQLVRGLDVRVLGTAGTPAGRELALAQGADAVFDHRAPDVDAQIREATGGQGVDVIVEMLANENLDRDLSLLLPGGRVAVVGNRGRIEIDPRKTMLPNTSILGVGLLSLSLARQRALHAQLAPKLARGQLSPIVREVLPLAQAARAHETLMTAGALGKLVLQP